MAHWTSKYFGNLYHEIYRQHILEPQRALDEAAFASHILDLGRRKVLDLACGYGRHARLLASSNKVYAVDANHSYLKEMMADVSGRVKSNLFPVCADMRSIPLPDKSVDAVVVLFNSFGYFDAGSNDDVAPVAEVSAPGQVWKLPNVFYERQLVDSSFGRFRDPITVEHEDADDEDETVVTAENLQVLSETFRVLKPGGGILLEVPNPRPLLQAVEENPRRLMVMQDCEIHEEFEWNSRTKRLLNRTRFVMGEKEESATYSLRLYDAAELKSLLKEAGFIVRRTYGDYCGDRFRPASSDVILAHASRPAR